MWIYSEIGFFSIVEDQASKGRNLLVRARVDTDLEALIDLGHQHGMRGGRIRETPDADYRFRVSLPRRTVLDLVAVLTGAIKYPNFKGRIGASKHGRRLGLYSRIHHLTAEGLEE
jgi:hypothetical protein